ncbi:hypothetical protein TI05_10345 [Achromatium sp. WMS3]|nr:hypothetical protein TI05_10345 [Achromatium sp. WMS3]
MRILLIKTSSLGDLIHTFPAISDAVTQMPNIVFDWVVEESFTEIPTWHPSVHTVIPIAMRRWRNSLLSISLKHEVSLCVQQIRKQNYDLIIDAQGLIKSALFTYLAKGNSVGLDWHSAREPLASMLYKQCHVVPHNLHAVERIRQLFAKALKYTIPKTPAKYGLQLPFALTNGISNNLVRKDHTPYLVFIPATTWPSKHWPVLYWVNLIKMATSYNYQVFIPWYSPKEQQLAESILNQAQAGTILPRQSLTDLAKWLVNAAGVVGVDTGLVHIASALEVPVISLYGPTSSKLTGTLGVAQRILNANFPCAPCRRKVCNYHLQSVVQPACFNDITPILVWNSLQKLIKY